MFSFRSFADLASVIRREFAQIHSTEPDIIVGIPRSGLIPATYISSILGIPMTDFDSFISGKTISHGYTRALPSWQPDATVFRRPLIVDDSILSGWTMRRKRDELLSVYPSKRFYFLAVFGTENHNESQISVLERCPVPRIFEWNILDSWVLPQTFFDLDGVLCRDPTNVENDDGEKYRKFVSTVKPYALPRKQFLGVVTSRLEKYRLETEHWLQQQNLQYNHLYMLDVKTAEERAKYGLHADFKASVYGNHPEARLFLESNPAQARRITERTGKDVIDYQNMVVASPEDGGLNFKQKRLLYHGKNQMKGYLRAVKRRVNRIVR